MLPVPPLWPFLGFLEVCGACAVTRAGGYAVKSAARTRVATPAVPGCSPDAEPSRPRAEVAWLGVGSICWRPSVSAARADAAW